ncbi:MAG: hypothetical protein JNK87_17010 [Bryobacterales bacterium]|nr:hypothetical protein [Bryobacterales bacterium]
MALTMKDLAEKDKRVSLIWAANAIRALTELDKVLKQKGSPAAFTKADLPPFLHHVRDALQTHFNINTATNQSALVVEILGRYQAVVTSLGSSSSLFVNDTTSAEATKGTPAHVPFGSGKVNFTPAFREHNLATGVGFGPFARAAMVLHEPVHVVDHPNASFVVNHVHEGDAAYAATPAANQVHNAHSYASFAQHMNFGKDTRFGATKPQF